MGSIATFYWTATVAVVFYSVLQWRDIELLQYICFSDSNLDIVALQKPAAINISFCANTIAAVKKTAAIGTHFATRLLSYSGGKDHRNRPSNSLPSPKSSLFFFFFRAFSFLCRYTISLISLPKTKNTIHSLYLSLTL